MSLTHKLPTAVLTLALALPFVASAQENVLNLYTARHYQTDEALYENFTKQTGIKINRIEGQEDPLLERIKSEGANSPADVFITVDVGRLWRAQQAGIFAPEPHQRSSCVHSLHGYPRYIQASSCL